MHYKRRRTIIHDICYKYYFKVAPWDDMNFGIWFCDEVVYLSDHEFNLFVTFCIFS